MEEMIYMRDIPSCYIREFKASVRRVDRENSYIVLDRTAFYPEGGGQPNDVGEIKWDGGSARVVNVIKRNRVLHYIEGDLPPEGTKVGCKLDWERRYSHMKMHTAQHLISSIVWEMYGAVTVGNQIHADHSHIDLHPLDIGNDDVAGIEKKVNELIKKKLPVTVEVLTKESLLERKVNDRVNMSRLPSSVRELRTVFIDGGKIDLCPCAGTHVGDTSELGILKITKRRSKGHKKIRIQYILE